MRQKVFGRCLVPRRGDGAGDVCRSRFGSAVAFQIVGDGKRSGEKLSGGNSLEYGAGMIGRLERNG